MVKKVLCALALSVVANAGSAATITNGSFENYNIDGQWFRIVTSDNVATYLPGWKVNGEVDLVNKYFPAGEGANSLDLNAHAAGGVSQTLTDLDAGSWYKVGFLLTYNFRLRGLMSQLKVDVDGVSSIYSTPVDHNTRGWTQKSFFFQALSETATLSFTSLVPGASGPALDAVTISRTSAHGVDFGAPAPAPAPVPLPASGIMLLAGIAGAFGLRRRG